MPKIVDHEARRREVTEAVWRVVRRDGLEAASVRNVASEAGLSAGAMRHYFDGHQALQTAAMRAMVDRIGERVRAVAQGPGTAREQATRALLELLPLDADRQAEAEVWFAFVAEARVDEAFRALAAQTFDEIRTLVAQIVGALAPARTARERTVETERLFALVDGLALHAVQRPGALSPSIMRAAVERHLDELAG